MRAGVVGADHHLVQLLARADADDLVRPASGDMTLTRSRMRHGRDLGHENLAAAHHAPATTVRTPRPRFRVIQNRVIRASVIGSSVAPWPSRRWKQRRRPCRACPRRCRSGPPQRPGADVARQVVGGHEGLVRGQLGRAVQVDRVAGLVGRQGHHLLTPLLRLAQTTFSAPSTLVWMHSEGLYSAAGTCFRAAAWMTISTPRRARVEALAVAYVAQEEAHLCVGRLVELLAQLQLHVAASIRRGMDDHLPRIGASQHGLDETAAEPVPPVARMTYTVQIEVFGEKRCSEVSYIPVAALHVIRRARDDSHG